MPTLANYVVIRDTPAALPAGNVQNDPFDTPAVDTTAPAILLFRVFPTLTAGLELRINGSVIFSVPAFNVDGGRTLHEVVPAAVNLLPAGNVLTMTNNGAASINVASVALLFQT